MNKYISWIVELLKVISLILILGLSMSACGAGNIKWKEEVQLTDGRIIVVEREAIYAGGGDEWASNRAGSKIKEDIIRFANPDESGKFIGWRSMKLSPQTYPEIPLVLDIIAGQPVLFSLVAISSGCEVYSKYVYQNGKWHEELLTEIFEPKKTNLLFGTQRDLPKLLSLDEKDKRNDGSGYRKALKQIGPTAKVCG